MSRARRRRPRAGGRGKGAWSSGYLREGTGAIGRSRRGGTIEGGERSTEDVGALMDDVVARARRDEQPAVVDGAREGQCLGDRHERVAVAAGDERGRIDGMQ